MIRKYSAGPESISPHFRPFGNDVRIENRQAIWIKKMTTCPIYIGCLSHSLLYGIILKDKCQYKATIPTSKILLGGPIIFRKKQNLEFVLVLMKIKKKCEESKQFSLYRLISNLLGYVETMLANISRIFSVKSQNKSEKWKFNNIESNGWFWSKSGKPKSYGSDRIHMSW